MTEGDRLDHTAAAMRSALCDQTMVRFDAPQLVGITPQAGRVIEQIEVEGRHLHLHWDDGVVLHTNLKRHGWWGLYHEGQYWQGRHDDMRALIEVPGWVAVCFSAPEVETYRTPNPRRHPGLGGIGPDLARPDADLSRCVMALLTSDEPNRRLHDVLLDDRYFYGVGNVIRSEALWACALHPFGHLGDLGERDAVRLVATAARLVRHRLGTADCRRAVYGLAGRACPRCHEAVNGLTIGTPARSLYWCEGCQTRSSPPLDETPPVADRHPAAARYLDDLARRRTG
jgi:endonuclease-8